MIKKQRMKVFTIVIVWEILLITSLYFTKRIALSFYLSPLQSRDPFYWLSPVFAAVQASNIIVAWGGFLQA